MATKKPTTKTIKSDAETLEKLTFTLEGPLDVLPGVANALSFVLNHSEELQKIPGSKHVYECSHCIKGMLSLLDQMHAMIKEGGNQLSNNHFS